MKTFAFPIDDTCVIGKIAIGKLQRQIVDFGVCRENLPVNMAHVEQILKSEDEIINLEHTITIPTINFILHDRTTKWSYNPYENGVIRRDDDFKYLRRIFGVGRD